MIWCALFRILALSVMVDFSPALVGYALIRKYAPISEMRLIMREYGILAMWIK